MLEKWEQEGGILDKTKSICNSPACKFTTIGCAWITTIIMYDSENASFGDLREDHPGSRDRGEDIQEL